MLVNKNTLNVIDDTIKNIGDISKQFIEIDSVLKTAKNELIALENEKKGIEQEKRQLEGEKLDLQQEKSQLENEKLNLQQETKKLEGEKLERDQKIGSLTSEQQRLLNEYASLKVELTKFAKIAEEREQDEFNIERIKALLSIYSMLINEIWQGQPHYRILWTLHGAAEEMSREQLKKTTGIGGAFVLRAINELAKINMVEHDIETTMVKLKRRLFDKESLG